VPHEFGLSSGGRVLEAYEVGRILNKCTFVLTMAWLELDMSDYQEESPESIAELSLGVRCLVAPVESKEIIQDRTASICRPLLHSIIHNERHVDLINFYYDINNFDYDLADSQALSP
jgi:hypothetical protein